LPSASATFAVMNDRVNTFALQLAETPADTTGAVWIKIMPAGRFAGRGHDGVFDAGDQSAMQAIVDRSLAHAGATELMIDYDHQSVFGVGKGAGGRAEAAGWMKDLQARPDGIYAQVEWTGAAQSKIGAKEYRYLSPYFFSNPRTGAVTRIQNAALVNVPALDLPVATAASARFPTETEESDMKSIAKALGLADDASETAILAAITGNHSKIALAAGLKADATIDAIATAAAAAVSGLGKVAVAAGLKADAAVDDIATAFAGGKAGEFVPVSMFNDLSLKFKTLEATVTGDAVEQAVATAMSEGKVTPASETWARDYATENLAGFKAFAATAPVLTKVQLGDGKQVADTGELDANAMAAKARAYQDEQAAAGVTITIIQAVDHVVAQAKTGK
jgi:phage I-like protein